MPRYSNLEQDVSSIAGDSSPSHYDSEDSCFFADATLEDAHHLVDSPATAGRATIISSSLFDSEDDEPNNNNNKKKNNKNSSGKATTSTILNNNHPLLLLDTLSNHGNRGEDRVVNQQRQQEQQQHSSGYFLNVPAASAAMSSHANTATALRRKRPPIPRDIAWAAYATMFIPISFLVPFWITHRHADIYTTPPHDAIAPHVGDVIYGWNYAASSHRGHVATLLSAILAYGAATLLSVILYRNPASGDDGEDARHQAASHVTLISHYVALGAIYPLLLALLYTEFPRATSITLWTVVLLVSFARDLFILRKTTSLSLLQDHGQGRRRFFRTLTCASLDILSRSLRRLSFYRIVSAALLLQLILVVTWRSALFVALSIPLDTGVTGVRTLLILATLLGGKWATSIVARCLGLIASGGVTVWFAQQQHHLRVSSSPLLVSSASGPNNTTIGSDDGNTVEFMDVPTYESTGKSAEGAGKEEEGIENNSLASTASTSNKMPEAYRSVDANAYRSVNDFDDANIYYDDDDLFAGDDLEEISDHPPPQPSPPRYTVDNTMRISTMDGNGTTARHFLLQAVTISFGSVAKCALLGGLAQFVWSCLRNIRVAQVILARRRAASTTSNTGFQGMDVRTITRSSESGREETIYNMLHQLARSCQDICRQFVTSHTDLGMTHVATYYKSYSRAAMDVTNLVHSSGKFLSTAKFKI